MIDRGVHISENALYVGLSRTKVYGIRPHLFKLFFFQYLIQDVQG